MRSAAPAVPLLLATLALATTIVTANEPSQDPKVTAVQLTRQLEEHPLGKQARQARSRLMEWLVSTPDVTVPYCQVLLAPLTLEFRYAEELMNQMLFSSAAFMIENPDKADDDPAVYLAGLTGALEAYDAIVAEKPKTRIPRLDDLSAKRGTGRLARFVEEGMVSCRSRDSEP